MTVELAHAQKYLSQVANQVYDYTKAHPWISAGIATGSLIAWRILRAPRNLPPGPVNLPFIGAVSCMAEDIAVKMVKWKPLYGDIISYSMFGKTSIMLNSDRAIREAFLKLGEEFSHRPMDLMSQILNLQDELFSSPFDEKWKKNKKFTMTALKNFGFGTPKSEEKIHTEISKLEKILHDSKGKPINVRDSLMSLAIGVIYSILMNENYEWDDPESARISNLITEWYKALTFISVQVMILAEILHPAIAKLLFKSRINALKVITRKILDFNITKVEEHRRTIQPGEPRDVLDYYLIERAEDPSITDELLANIFLTFVPDATDTVSNIQAWMLLYMTHFQDVQKRIHRELDDVCGNSRPSLAQRNSLPFTLATVYESVRYLNVFSVSPPRILHKDVKLRGYNFPKGSMVSANLYAAHKDPEVFPEPDKFYPDRFIKSDGTFDTALSGKVISWSVGARMCPGEQYVKAFLFLFLARVLQKFEVRLGPDSQMPDLAKGDGVYIRVCEPVDISYLPR